MTDGIPYLDIPQLTAAERASFWSRVNKSAGHDACWPWTKGSIKDGYGGVTFRRTSMVVHRVAFTLVNGRIPAGMQVDHTCHNRDQSCPGGDACEHRRCCNPAHLEAVTARTNTIRGRSLQAQNAAKTHCKNGHPLSGDNLYVPPSNDGRRYCKTCRAEANNRRYGRSSRIG